MSNRQGSQYFKVQPLDSDNPKGMPVISEVAWERVGEAAANECERIRK
jgi:hypothetical protein